MERNQDKEIATEIGKKIASLRKEVGLSQSELAERTGMKQSSISRLESGAHNATVEILNNIARVLGKKIALIDATDIKREGAENAVSSTP